jgi:hypothetical protein
MEEYVDAHAKILNSNFGKFRNEKIEERCIKSYARAVACLIDR